MPDRDFSPVLIERYNSQAAFEFERIRDFLILHYWAPSAATRLLEICSGMSIPEPLPILSRLFKDSGRFFRNAEEMFAITSWVQVMLGPTHCAPALSSRSRSHRGSRNRGVDRQRKDGSLQPAWTRCRRMRSSLPGTARLLLRSEPTRTARNICILALGTPFMTAFPVV